MKKPASRSSRKTVEVLPAPQPFQAKSLKRKQFSSDGDVHIQGDVTIATQLIVGGDMLIDGDLIAEEVFCLGKLTVTGDIQVQSLYIGQTLDTGGNIDVEFLLKTGCDAEWMARLLELDQKPLPASGRYTDLLVHPAIAQRGSQHDLPGSLGDIQGLGYLSCEDLDCHGNLQLDDDLEAGEVLFVGGHLAASSIAVRADCNCEGEVFSESKIEVGGSLFAAEIMSQGNLTAGAIGCQGDISAWGYIRAKGDISSLFGEIHAGRWIGSAASLYAAKYVKAGESVIAEKGISSGKDYGIFAGSVLARSAWPKQGLISSASKPRGILSGVFVEGKKLRYLDGLEKKRDSELDWELNRRVKREMLVED